MNLMVTAIRAEAFGGPEVLKKASGKFLQALKPDQVLIRVHAAGVNPVDTYIRAGAFPIRPPLPYTPGFDAAGEILEVGKNAGQFKVGQRVYTTWGDLSGSYATHVTAPALHVHPLPDRLTFEQGAALGIPYYTAYRALFTLGQAKAGETVLIHGASGAVGVACCQIGKALGLRVYGTAGTDSGLELVKANGAIKAFNHRKADYRQEIEKEVSGGVNIIVEMLADKNLSQDCEMVAQSGRVMVIGARGTTNFDPGLIIGKEVRVNGVLSFATPSDDVLATSKALHPLLESGAINPVIAKEYKLEQASQAHTDILENKGTMGKLILKMD